MKANKHDHKGTKALKTALFSVVMLLPIISIGATILTHTFNEKVETPSKDVNITYMYETNEVNSASDLIPGNIYAFNWNNYDFDSILSYEPYSEFIFTPISNLIFEGSSVDLEYGGISGNTYINDKTTIYLFGDLESKYITFCVNGDYNADYISINAFDVGYISDILYTESSYFTFIYIEGNYLNEDIANAIFKANIDDIPIKNVEVTETADTITNIFEYASNEVFNTNIFGWTNTSIIKTPISAFTSMFGVDNANVLNNYLTYWLAVTGIYIVIDIIIETFVFITHLLNKDGI